MPLWSCAILCSLAPRVLVDRGREEREGRNRAIAGETLISKALPQSRFLLGHIHAILEKRHTHLNCLDQSQLQHEDRC